MTTATTALAPTLPATASAEGLGGLLATVGTEQRPLPLQDVKVRASIAGSCCRVVIDQRYANPYEQPLEAVHIFPLPEDGAVIGAELRAGEVVVRAQCCERQEAERTFEQAREDGHRAALLTAERADVHTLRVTNLPPGEEVTVRIEVVEHLDSVDGQLRWRFPTTIPPRYLPGTPIGHEGPGVLPDTDQAPDASRLQPPLRLAGGTSLDLEVTVDGPVAELSCSLHAVRLSLGEAIRVAPAASATCDRDFALAITSGEPDAPVLQAWSDGTHTLALVQPPTGLASRPIPRDAVFVVDISGSMGGTKLGAAKRALTAALHGLETGDRFRLVAFDDRIERFAAGFTPVSDRALTKADRWIGELFARGGTHMAPALKEAFRDPTPAGRLRTVLFLTDGQAWNEDELVALVASHRDQARLFTLGIDTAVNGALLKRLARVGGGTCELATPDDDLDDVVASVEARFGSPVVHGLRVLGGTPARDGAVDLFDGRPAVLWLEGAPDTVVVEGSSVEGPVRLEATPHRSELPLGVLWARARIATLEDRIVLQPAERPSLEEKILELALVHGLASRFTAFVAVETSRTIDGERIELLQPTELPSQWSERFKGASVCAAAGEALPPLSAQALFSRAAPRRQKKARSLGVSSLLGWTAKPAEEGVEDIVNAMEMGVAACEPAEFRDEAVVPAGKAWRPAKPADPTGDLARRQQADGSWGGDVLRTAAALLALVLAGHTRKAGSRRRTVRKAARWLAAHTTSTEARLVLAVLEGAEQGQAPDADPAWSSLEQAGAEGTALRQVRAGL